MTFDPKSQPVPFKAKISLLLVSSLTIMSIITISPALPLIADHFVLTNNSALLSKLTLTIPALFIAITSPIAGKLIDRSGRLKLLWPAMILYAIAGSAGLYLDNLYLIIFSRILLGVAVGISMTIVITLVGDYFEGIARQKFLGLQVAFMSIAGIVFIGLGGFFADISWRLPFILYLLSLAVLPFALKFLPEPQVSENNGRLNFGIKAPRFIWILFFHTMIMWIIFFLIPVHLPFYLIDIGVEKKVLIGIAIACSTLFSAVSSLIYSRLKDRLSFPGVFVTAYFIMAISFALLSLADSYIMVIFSMILAGLGVGIIVPNTNMWVMKISPAEIRGQEIGKLTTF